MTEQAPSAVCVDAGLAYRDTCAPMFSEKRDVAERGGVTPECETDGFAYGAEIFCDHGTGVVVRHCWHGEVR